MWLLSNREYGMPIPASKYLRLNRPASKQAFISKWVWINLQIINLIINHCYTLSFSAQWIGSIKAWKTNLFVGPMDPYHQSLQAMGSYQFPNISKWTKHLNSPFVKWGSYVSTNIKWKKSRMLVREWSYVPILNPFFRHIWMDGLRSVLNDINGIWPAELQIFKNQILC